MGRRDARKHVTTCGREYPTAVENAKGEHGTNEVLPEAGVPPAMVNAEVVRGAVR